MRATTNFAPCKRLVPGRVSSYKIVRPKRSVRLQTIAPDHELRHITALDEAAPAKPEALSRRVWYEKGDSQAFKSVADAEELSAVLTARSGKHKAVELFAGEARVHVCPLTRCVATWLYT